MRPPDSPPGLLGSFRALGDTLLATAQDRVELVSLELQEEKFRLIGTFTWISVAALAGALAVACASLALVSLFPASARPAVLGGLALLYAGAAVAAVIALRRHLARQPRPFAATIDELTEDRACIPREN